MYSTSYAHFPPFHPNETFSTSILVGRWSNSFSKNFYFWDWTTNFIIKKILIIWKYTNIEFTIAILNIQFVHLCLENTTDGETVDTHDDHWHNICNLKPFNINCVTIVGRGFITLIFHRRMSCNGHSTFDIVIFLQENKFCNFCIDVS